MSPLRASDLVWLPAGSSYPTPLFDPRATVQAISLLNYDVEGEDEQVAYVPVTLSMKRQFVRINRSQNKFWEIGMSFSIYSQWSIVDVGEAFLGGLQNTDYRISGTGTYTWNASTHARISLFHQSSHLGDDYIIRNNITIPALRTLNYEQIDINFTRLWGDWQLYTGLGYNVSPNTVRGRGTFQIGFERAHLVFKNQGYALKYGCNVNMHEQNDYSPNIRAGFGIEMGRNTATPFTVMVSAYTGHLPYSTLEYQRVRLLGLSLVFNVPGSRYY